MKQTEKQTEFKDMKLEEGYYRIPYEVEEAINNACAIVHDWAKKKGWWDEEKNDGECIALMHSELSEALEAIRAKDQPFMDDKLPNRLGRDAELADVLIRIFDYCGAKDIPLGNIVAEKHDYNITRPYKHGGKKF